MANASESSDFGQSTAMSPESFGVLSQQMSCPLPFEARPSTSSRWIAHLDMDAFYASVELLRHPELRGQPVVIGGGRKYQPVKHPDGSWRFTRLRHYAGRGVVTTATYPARDTGIRAGMGLMKAAQLAPDALLLPVDFAEYHHWSRLFKAAVAEVTPLIEDRGIDEVYVDLSHVPGVHDIVGHDPLSGVRAVAQEIKNSVRCATGLSCSIGVTPNKLLSKLASDLNKPDGLTIVTMADIEQSIWPLPVRHVNGIGPKASARLAQLGIHSIGDLAGCDGAWLIQYFGRRQGIWLSNAARGIDDRPVITHIEPVSMSRETTFERDLHAVYDRDALTRLFTRLCNELFHDLRSKGYMGRTIGIKLRFDDFKTLTRDFTLGHPVDDFSSIRHAAGQCLKRINLSRRIRLLGVRAGSLMR